MGFKFDFEGLTDGLGDLISDVANEIANDGMETGVVFWDSLNFDEIPEAKTALRRYAENNLAALRDPANAETHKQSAAHNLNTLINLGAKSQVNARREARKFMERVTTKILDAAASAIDLLL